MARPRKTPKFLTVTDPALLPVGGMVWFEGERLRYNVQARSSRFLVCTKPFNPLHTVLYSVVDLQEQVRGTEDLIFGFGAETPELCWAMIARLEDGTTQVSKRNRTPLRIRRMETLNKP